jgi:anti-anti-sigma regulatory factor
MDGTRNATILRLEGRLTGLELDELRSVIAECARDHRRVVVDLAGLTSLDEPAARMLVSAHEQDVALAGASPFIRGFLDEVAS